MLPTVYILIASIGGCLLLCFRFFVNWWRKRRNPEEDNGGVAKAASVPYSVEMRSPHWEEAIDAASGRRY